MGCLVLLEGNRNPDGRGIWKTVCRAQPQSHAAKSKMAGLKLNHDWQPAQLNVHISLDSNSLV